MGWTHNTVEIISYNYTVAMKRTTTKKKETVALKLEGRCIHCNAIRVPLGDGRHAWQESIAVFEKLPILEHYRCSRDPRVHNPVESGDNTVADYLPY